MILIPRRRPTTIEFGLSWMGVGNQSSRGEVKGVFKAGNSLSRTLNFSFFSLSLKLGICMGILVPL